MWAALYSHLASPSLRLRCERNPRNGSILHVAALPHCWGHLSDSCHRVWEGSCPQAQARSKGTYRTASEGVGVVPRRAWHCWGALGAQALPVG